MIKRISVWKKLKYTWNVKIIKKAESIVRDWVEKTLHDSKGTYEGLTIIIKKSD